MGGGNKSTRNELLIGLSPQETMQQSADIIKIVDDMATINRQYLYAKYGGEFGGVNELIDAVIGRLGRTSTYRRGVQNIFLRYCGRKINKEEIRASLRCDNNRVSELSDKVYFILDGVHASAMREVEIVFNERGLI